MKGYGLLRNRKQSIIGNPNACFRNSNVITLYTVCHFASSTLLQSCHYGLKFPVGLLVLSSRNYISAKLPGSFAPMTIAYHFKREVVKDSLLLKNEHIIIVVNIILLSKMIRSNDKEYMFFYKQLHFRRQPWCC